MNTRRPMFGLVVLVALVGIGYLVLTLTPAAITGYSEAAKMNPYVGYAYLGLIAFGGMFFFGVLSWLVYRLWRNTKENAKQTDAAAAIRVSFLRSNGPRSWATI